MSPLPVLAEVLSMTESGRVRPAVALALGYALALAVIAVAAVVVGSQATSGSTASTTTAIVDLIAGVLLLLGALRTRSRSRHDPDAGLPKWISRVGSMSTVFAFALGAFLPPYVVALAAGNEIVREGLSGGMAWAQAAVFVVVACIGVVTPIVDRRRLALGGRGPARHLEGLARAPLADGRGRDPARRRRLPRAQGRVGVPPGLLTGHAAVGVGA